MNTFLNAFPLWLSGMLGDVMEDCREAEVGCEDDVLDEGGRRCRYYDLVMPPSPLLQSSSRKNPALPQQSFLSEEENRTNKAFLLLLIVRLTVHLSTLPRPSVRTHLC